MTGNYQPKGFTMSDLIAAADAAYDTEAMTLGELFEAGLITAEDYAAELGDIAHERAKYGEEA